MKSEKVFKTSLPVILGYIPVGMTFGLLASQQGIDILITLLLSLLVYAGSAQFVALTFFSEPQLSHLQVFVTIWLINLRHFILSLAYLPNTLNWKLIDKVKMMSVLTDETFAVLANTDHIKQDFHPAFQVGLLNYFTWNLATLLGYLGGSLIPDSKVLGLDFALTAMFAGIVCLFIKKPSHWVTLITTIILTVVLFIFFDLGKNAVIVAAIAGSFIGWKWEQRQIT